MEIDLDESNDEIRSGSSFSSENVDEGIMEIHYIPTLHDINKIIFSEDMALDLLIQSHIFQVEFRCSRSSCRRLMYLELNKKNLRYPAIQKRKTIRHHTFFEEKATGVS